MHIIFLNGLLCLACQYLLKVLVALAHGFVFGSGLGLGLAPAVAPGVALAMIWALAEASVSCASAMLL